MDTTYTYIAAVLTPICVSLIHKIDALWLQNPFAAPRINPFEAPPVLMRSGVLGVLYLVGVAGVCAGSYLSLIGLMVFGSASALYTIGSVCIGFVCGGVCLAMFGQSYWLNNLIAHALLALNLLMIHWIAWASV